MSEELAEVLPRQNPRTSRVRQLIMDAAVELLLTDGASEVTATRVAAVTGVARTTVYRQWPDQEGLLLDAIGTLVAPDVSTPVTGDLLVDLKVALVGLRKRLTTRPVRMVFGALAGNATRGQAFVAAQRAFVDGLNQPTLSVLRDSQKRGRLDDSLDCSPTVATLTGPLLYLHLVMHEPIDDRLIDDVAEQFVVAHPPPHP